jgi:hypothetical protein
MENFSLPKLADLIKALDTLSPRLDDCMWINERGYEALKERFVIAKAKSEVKFLSANFVGVRIFEDDTLADFVVQSGTIDHGEKIVKHTYWIGPHDKRLHIEWPMITVDWSNTKI